MERRTKPFSHIGLVSNGSIYHFCVRYYIWQACFVSWEARVVGWEVSYGAEFVPSSEDGYTIIIQKNRRINEEVVICSRYKVCEPGKLLLTINNPTSRKKKLLYRFKTIMETTIWRKHHLFYYQSIILAFHVCFYFSFWSWVFFCRGSIVILALNLYIYIYELHFCLVLMVLWKKKKGNLYFLCSNIIIKQFRVT